jgi:streptogramin lyase
MIYGVTVDKDDTVYAVDWSGKIAALHGPTATADGVGSWRTYVPPVYPAHIRRPRADYQGNIMYGIWSGGPQSPAMIGQFDPRTGRHTQWRLPERLGSPYDEFPDPDRNRVWFPDSGNATRGAQIGVLDRKTGTFTFYPRPQFDADSPKISVTRDGAVWYGARRQANPRPGRHRDTAVGVLYPDKEKITEGAFYVNGPPGYAFKPGQ